MVRVGGAPKVDAATILPAILTYLTSVFRFVRCQQTRDDRSR